MKSLRKFAFASIAIFLVVFPLGMTTLADDDTSDDTIGPFTVSTSYGIDFTITNQAQAQRELNAHEGYLENADKRMSKRKAELDAIIKGFNGEISSLDDILTNITATIALGKPPPPGVTAVFVKKILNILRGRNARKTLYLMVLDKYSEIEALNTEIANKFSDRNKFHIVLAKFEGFERDFQVQDKLAHVMIKCVGRVLI